MPGPGRRAAGSSGDRKQGAMRRTGVVRAAIVLITLSVLIVLDGCASVRYQRGWVLAGENLLDMLQLTGDSFRLERASSRGLAVFVGRFDVDGDQWRFSLEAWKPAEGPSQQFIPPLVYVYRGRTFVNGIAFYAVIAPRGSPVDLFIRVPCDFDIVS